MLRLLQRLRRVWASAVCLVAIPCVATAQNAFSPGGPDYKIVGSLPGDQTWPQAAISTNGGYLVWQDNSIGTNGLNIRAVRLNASLGQAGAPFRVNAQTVGEHEKPQVALLNNGGAVFVWQGGKLGYQKIYARFLNAAGSFTTTTNILVNTYTNEFQINPAVATLRNGNVVVVWASYGQDGDLQGIYGQLFSPSGAKIGTEFQINQWPYGNQRTPAVAALANGNFVVTWVSELQRSSRSVDIYARLFDSTGAPLCNEFPVNITTSNVCANPAIAASPRGGFAVVWSQNDNVTLTSGSRDGVVVSGVPTRRSTNSWDVFMRIYDGSGAAMTAPVLLNTWRFGDQFGPRLSSFGANYLAVWTSLGQDTHWEGVFGQFVSGSGGLEGVEFQVNTTPISRQIQPTVATDGVSRFLALWTSFGAGTSFDLFARQYDLIQLELVTTQQGLVLTWNTAPGSTYQVQTSTNYSTWSNYGAARTASGFSDSVTIPASNNAAFFRVIRVQ